MISGKWMTLKEIAETTGGNYHTIYKYAYDAGWTAEQGKTVRLYLSRLKSSEEESIRIPIIMSNAEIARLTAKSVKKEEINRSLNSENTRLKRSITELNNEITMLKRENVSLTEKLSRLRFGREPKRWNTLKDNNF